MNSQLSTLNSQPASLAAAYGRASTNKQEQSLVAQTDRLRSYAARENLVLPDTALFLEDDVSGAIPFADRPRAGQLLSQFQAGQFRHLIVPTIDRLGRDALDVQNTIQRIHQLEGTVHVLDLGGSAFNTRSPVSGLIIAVLAWAAQMELVRIRERVTSGLGHKRTNGELCGTVPYGWNAIATGETRTNKGGKLVAIKRIEPNPVEQKWILHMHRLRTAGWSYHAIARDLNGRNVPTKTGAGNVINYKGNTRFSRGKWQCGNVARILNNATVKAWLETQNKKAA